MPCHILEPTEQNIAFVLDLLVNAKQVALPTETVYGLAANALDDQAVAGIYALKNRPHFNPLIAHCRSLEQAAHYVHIDAIATKLAKALWPGPLTLVLPQQRTTGVSQLATAGLDTLAVRVPQHPVMQTILNKLDFPLVAPSANPSESISPTAAVDVVTGFQDLAADLWVVEGGGCTIGLESTIVQINDKGVYLLRPGVITSQEIETVAGMKIQQAEGDQIIAPGQLRRHYAPRLPMRLNVTKVQAHEALLSFGPHSLCGAAYELNLSAHANLQEAAANLFKLMRRLDDARYQGIAVMPIPHQGIGIAINDRLKRAACK
jgi:translation factor SUA5